MVKGVLQIQTVGSKGYDGFTLAIVRDDTDAANVNIAAPISRGVDSPAMFRD